MPSAVVAEHRAAGRDRRERRGGHHGLDRADAARARAAVEKGGIGLVWSPNFSIGVNVFLHLVAEASRQLAPYPGIWRVGLGDPSFTKKDAPSGTLLQDGRGDEERRSETRR